MKGVRAGVRTTGAIVDDVGGVAAPPAEFGDAVVWAAWLYYVDQLTQSDVARALSVSRATVANHLQEARARGVVTVRLNDAAYARTTLARRVAERFDLAGCHVIPDLVGPAPLYGRLGEAGARLLATMLDGGGVLGVAWGKTVLALARSVPIARRPGLTVVQVAGSSAGSDDFSPELCTSLLAARLSARCVNLLAPALLSTPDLRDALLAEPALQRQFALIRRAATIVFGVGDLLPTGTLAEAGFLPAPELAAYIERGAIGVIIGRFIDAEGRAVRGGADGRMIGIALDELKRARVRLCVAGGRQKHAAIRATLLGGYATHLVTDTTTAAALVATS